MRWAVLMGLLVSTAAAHEFRPARLAWDADGPVARWTFEADQVGDRWPALAVAGCQPAPSEVERGRDRIHVRTRFTCARPARVIEVTGLRAGEQVLLTRDGRPPIMLDARAPRAELADPSRWALLPVGFEHILRGADHLLFLAALVLLVGRLGALLWALTGFTLGHAVTLVAATTGTLDLPSAPVEACIALSVVLLAGEVARGRGDTLLSRHPAALATFFGLVHGLGFAGALRPLLGGEPLGWPLLAFNLGIEAGQLVWVACLVWVGGAIARRSGVHSAALRGAAAHGIGAVAAFWLIDRVAGFWGG